MKKIVPDARGGVTVVEAPLPKLFENSVLCRMTHSLISSGTERKQIMESIGQASDDPVQRQALGYCGAGIVEEVQGTCISLEKGDRAAYYGGPWVSHSEYVVVPANLALPVPEGVDMECAAFIGLGAIALHGFRMAGARLGEICVVTGAGLLGNLCAQLAYLAGCRVIVSDPMPQRLDHLKRKEIICVPPGNLEEAGQKASESCGVDAVLLCVSTPSSEPMAQALRIIRPGGRIVVVGVLDLQIPREIFFQKEAEILISRAAGPGRYDMSYEKGGVDYPYQYVRWTEGRNLKEAMRLIASGGLEVKPLISCAYPLDRASEAYQRILSGSPDLAHVILWE